MKFFNSAIFLAFSLLLPIFLTQCAGSGSGSRETVTVVKKPGFNPHHGPFDSRGNYREEWADNPPRRIFVSSEEAAQNPIPVESIPAITSTTPSSSSPPPPVRPSYQPAAVTPRPKPKPTYVKPKTKPPIIHVVKKGDTLYSLARKYKSGVKTIKIANGLKGDLIRIGQKLKIPRY